MFTRLTSGLTSSLMAMLLLAALQIGAPSPATADFDKGMAAYKAGDYETALAEWSYAADLGNPRAQLALGHMYQFGIGGVTRNKNEAIRRYEVAAEKGHVKAMHRLFAIFSSGKERGDQVRAVYWLTQAAELGDTMAQNNLGVAYVQGKGLKQNYTNAAKWFQNAAIQGSKAAQFNLGTLYENGFGVSKDLILAYMWFALADSAKHNLAGHRRDEIERSISIEQAVMAKRLFIKCLASRYTSCGY